MDSFFSSKGLHILHLNVRSLLKKMTDIRLLFKSNKVGILCFTETFLDSSINDSEINVDNYTVVRRDRNRNGGGVCIYVRSDIVFNIRSDLDHEHIEAVWLDILLPKSKPILVGACYRPPDQNDFYKILEEVCANTVDFVKTEAIVIGDLNTNIQKNNTAIYKALKSFCYFFDLHQLIVEPTRICDSSQTTIDLILTSDRSKIANSGVIHYGLSDHSIIFCTRKIQRSAPGCHNQIKVRSLRNYSSEVLSSSLGSLDWSPVFDCSTTDKASDCFRSMFLPIVDKLAPIKEIRSKTRTEPWINPDILIAIEQRNKKFTIYRKNKDQRSLEEFKKYRNTVNRLVRIAKTDFFQ